MKTESAFLGKGFISGQTWRLEADLPANAEWKCSIENRNGVREAAVHCTCSGTSGASSGSRTAARAGPEAAFWLLPEQTPREVVRALPVCSGFT